VNPRALYFLVHGNKPARRAARRRQTGKGPARSWRYKAWIRTLPCSSCGTMRNIEAAHTGSDGGKAQKASDYTCVPLCSDCHQFAPGAYHRVSREEFERGRGLDLAQLVKTLNAAWRLGKEEAA
jgi:hypothetical protein